ncbi:MULTISPECIES: GNAT family N-acetyltransferase [unclassified Clostridium]|uniref:GNAT family N-acetyltransferase n=1 Tax=unclassified Clostridium TaxID=2614128 RepID=UPI0025BE13D9|nr:MULTISPECIES: GNAT family N-acetyltransferase [unclassified Clostridium]
MEIEGMKLSVIGKEDLEKIAEFIAVMNMRKENHIGYCGDNKEEILEILQEDFLPNKSLIFLSDEKEIAAVLGVDLDIENETAEVHGPFVDVRYGVNLALKLWNNILPLIPKKINKANMFFNYKNSLAMEFSNSLDFNFKSNEFILSLNREDRIEKLSDGVRILKEDEKDEFIKLHDSIFPNTYYSGDMIVNKINSKNKVYIYKDKDEILGYIYLEVCPEAQQGNIEYLGVTTNSRGCGLGVKLLNMAIDFVFSHDTIMEIILCVNCDNEAIKLYKKCGFKEKNFLKFYQLYL